MEERAQQGCPMHSLTFARFDAQAMTVLLMGGVKTAFASISSACSTLSLLRLPLSPPMPSMDPMLRELLWLANLMVVQVRMDNITPGKEMHHRCSMVLMDNL